MPKTAVFTMKLEAELHAEFMSAAAAAHRPASQVLRALMREYVHQQQDAREYDDYLQRKVEASRTQVAAGEISSNAKIEEKATTRREILRRRINANQ